VTAAELPIAIDHEKLAAFCSARGIRRLSLFGSVLRDDFDPARSDVDVLAELDPAACPGWTFFGWHEDLALILGRKVDLHTPASLSKYFRDEVLREALTVYEQA
jgi:predicted nucleotidyltransferase